MCRSPLTVFVVKEQRDGGGAELGVGCGIKGERCRLWKEFSWWRRNTELRRTGRANESGVGSQDRKDVEHLRKYLPFKADGSYFCQLNTRREDGGEIMDTGGFIEPDGETIKRIIPRCVLFY